MSRSNADRRAHQRVDTTLEVQGTPEEGGVVARMVASNLSAGGLYCTSTADFPEMTRLAVRLMLPGGGDKPDQTEPVDVEAVVVRREELTSTNGDSRYRFALFFTKVNDEARKRLAGFVDQPQSGPTYH